MAKSSDYDAVFLWT